MRRNAERQSLMLIGMTADALTTADNLIPSIKLSMDRTLARLSPTFATMYSKVGRPSTPPEHFLKASVLMALDSVLYELRFCERLEYDLLFNWFLDLNVANRP